MNDTKMRDAARERLAAAELAEVLGVPVARVAAESAVRQPFAKLAAAALLLLGLGVAVGVAVLQRHELAVAQEPPPFDPAFPWYEAELLIGHPPGTRFQVVQDATEAASIPLAPDDVLVLRSLDAELVAAAVQRPGVRRLSLGNTARLSPELWRAVGGMPDLVDLVVGAEFQVVGGPPELQTDGLRELRRCPNLRSLVLLGSHEWDFDAAAGHALAECSRLRSVCLSARSLTPDGLAALAQLPLLRCLVVCTHRPLDAGAGEAIAGLRGLQVLAVQQMGAGGNETVRGEFVSALAPMRTLQSLSLWGPVEGAALAQLPASLQALRVDQIDATTADMQRLLRLPKLRGLTLGAASDKLWEACNVKLLEQLQLEHFGSFRPLTVAMWQLLLRSPNLRSLDVQCDVDTALLFENCAKAPQLERLRLRLPVMLWREELVPLRKLSKLRRVELLSEGASSGVPSRREDRLAQMRTMLREVLGERVELVVQ